MQNCGEGGGRNEGKQKSCTAANHKITLDHCANLRFIGAMEWEEKSLVAAALGGGPILHFN
jgi:hypothetical protein